MMSKDRLHAVRELVLTEVLDEMTADQYELYLFSLNVFIDELPTLTGTLRSTLKARAYGALAMHLENTGDMLRGLHAEDLAGQCLKAVNTLRSVVQTDIDHDEIEALLENLIQSLSALSIDIQMSEHRSTARLLEKRSRPQIYAVDNSVMFLTNLQAMLANESYDLLFTTNCNEAVEYLSNNKPDAILLDVEMPDMDGFELAERVKSKGQKAPILFVTSSSARDCVNRAIEVGAVGVLMKPLRMQHLLEKLRDMA